MDPKRDRRGVPTRLRSRAESTMSSLSNEEQRQPLASAHKRSDPSSESEASFSPEGRRDQQYLGASSSLVAEPPSKNGKQSSSETGSDGTVSSLSGESKKARLQKTPRNAESTGSESDYESYSSLSGENQSGEEAPPKDKKPSSTRMHRKRTRVEATSEESKGFLDRHEKYVRFRGEESEGSDVVSSLSSENQRQKLEASAVLVSIAKAVQPAEEPPPKKARPEPVQQMTTARAISESEGNSSSGSGQNKGSSSDEQADPDKAGKVSSESDSASDELDKNPSAKVEAKEEILDDLVDDDDLEVEEEDASLTTPEGQMQKNPYMTYEEARIAAKREYNRRNAARARVRSKKLVDDLQQKVYKLTHEVGQLKNANQGLKAQVESLTKNNNDLLTQQHMYNAAVHEKHRQMQLMEQNQQLQASHPQLQQLLNYAPQQVDASASVNGLLQQLLGQRQAAVNKSINLQQLLGLQQQGVVQQQGQESQNNQIQQLLGLQQQGVAQQGAENQQNNQLQQLLFNLLSNGNGSNPLMALLQALSGQGN